MIWLLCICILIGCREGTLDNSESKDSPESEGGSSVKNRNNPADTSTPPDLNLLEKEGPQQGKVLAEQLQPVWLGNVKLYKNGRSEKPLFMNDEQFQALRENLSNGLTQKESSWEFVECGTEIMQGSTKDKSQCEYLVTRDWGQHDLDFSFTIINSPEGPRQKLTIDRNLQRPLIMRSKPLEAHAILIMDALIDENAENVGVILLPTKDIFHRDVAWTTSVLLGQLGPIKPKLAPLTLLQLSSEYEKLGLVKQIFSTIKIGIEFALLLLAFRGAGAQAKNFAQAISQFLKAGSKKPLLFSLAGSFVNFVVASGNFYTTSFHFLNLDKYEADNPLLKAAQFIGVVSTITSFSSWAVGFNMMKVFKNSWQFMHYKSISSLPAPKGIPANTFSKIQSNAQKLSKKHFWKNFDNLFNRIHPRKQAPKALIDQLDGLSMDALRAELSQSIVELGVSFTGHALWVMKFGEKGKEVGISPVGKAVKCENPGTIKGIPEEYGCAFWQEAGEIKYPIGPCFKYFTDLLACRKKTAPPGFSSQLIEEQLKTCLKEYNVSSCIQPLHFCVLTNSSINEPFMSCIMRQGGSSCFIGACQSSE